MKNKSLINLKRSVFLLIIFFGAVYACNKGKANFSPPLPPVAAAPVDSGWEFETTPVWADEFDNNGLPDTNKWGYDIGGDGWGNNELEYYTDAKNATINNGILSIDARKEYGGGKNYTSARMVTKGKGDFLYGRFEVKAQLPAGKGLWPAIWMLPTDNVYGGWPNSGEIDIMEQVGFDPDAIHISVHTEKYNHIIGTQKTAVVTVSTATSDFHIYRVDWTPYDVKGYIDGNKTFEFINEGKGASYFPFNQKFHILLNIAVGGNWGGQQGVDDCIFPAKMQVDYARVYKMKNK